MFFFKQNFLSLIAAMCAAVEVTHVVFEQCQDSSTLRIDKAETGLYSH